MNRAALIVILGVIALLGLAQSLERHMVAAQEAAPVDSLTLAAPSSSSSSGALVADAPVGTCARCGAVVYPAWTDKNSRLEIRDPRQPRPLWKGCFECLYDVLRRNP